MASTLSVNTGRFLLGLYFLVPGLMKFTQSAETLAYMQSHGIPFAEPLLWFAGLTNVIGGLLLMSGRHVKLVSYGFVLYVLLVNIMLHDFWTMSGETAARETQNFIKNLGILAGLLVLAGYASPRSLSFKGWWRSDKSIASGA
ncbi:MAG: DoxX family protein [Pseudomonadota bacterium]